MSTFIARILSAFTRFLENRRYESALVLIVLVFAWLAWTDRQEVTSRAEKQQIAFASELAKKEKESKDEKEALRKEYQAMLNACQAESNQKSADLLTKLYEQIAKQEKEKEAAALKEQALARKSIRNNIKAKQLLE